MKPADMEAFRCFARQWALLSAGTAEDWNTMTISWGGLGTLWGKSVATVYVKPCRYTYEYMERSENFTVSFFPEAYREDLMLLGQLSGRDGDKVARTRLTPRIVEGGIGFEQAERTLLCRKIYWQDLDLKQIPEDVRQAHYLTEAPHRVYIGEVLAIRP